MTNKRFDKLFGGPPRKPESLLTQRGDGLGPFSARSDGGCDVANDTAHLEGAKRGQKNLCLWPVVWR